MIPKNRRREYILDKLHRGFVNVCIAASLITGSMLAYSVYEYIRYVRPLRKQLNLQTQEGLLAEGRPLAEIAAEVTQQSQ